MHAFDYKALKRGMNASAHAYPHRAKIFAEINQILLERLPQGHEEPIRILDLGAGTGQLSRELLKIFPKARIYCLDLAYERMVVAKGKRKWFRQQHYITGDMHALPFAAESFDLVISNLTWYWADHPHQAIYEAKRVLKMNGNLLFSTLGPDTLRELRSSFASVSTELHVNTFLDMHDLGDALLKAGFADPVMDSEHLAYEVKTLSELLHFLQSIGESNYHSLRSRTLLGKTRYQKMCENYEGFRSAAGLPVSVEVVFGYAWRKAEAERSENEISVPLSSLKRA